MIRAGGSGAGGRGVAGGAAHRHDRGLPRLQPRTGTIRLRSRRLTTALLGVAFLASAALGVTSAQAQTAAPPPPASPTPSPVAPVTPAPTAPDHPDQTEEALSVTGAANPVDAPLLGLGTVVDTILATETLWYALDAAPGQRVGAAVLVVGRPDGPIAEDTFVAVTITDPQRQPLDGGDAEFTGQTDALVELAGVEIPAIGGDQPLMSVSLRTSTGEPALEGTGYRLQLTVTFDGDPLPPAATAPPVTASPAEPQPGVTVTSAPLPPPRDPDIVGDLLPFALISLAIGGFAGFELSRRGL